MAFVVLFLKRSPDPVCVCVPRGMHSNRIAVQADAEDLNELVEGAPEEMSIKLQAFVELAQSEGLDVPDGFDGHEARDPTNPQV